MTVYFRVEFDCTSCNAHTIYEDEVPIVYKDRNATIENNKAEKWMIEHINFRAKGGHNINEMRPFPNNISISSIQNPANLLSFIDAPYINLSRTKFILCVVCGGRIYFG